MDQQTHELILKAAKDGKLSKRQSTALQRLAQKASHTRIEHMLGLMSHMTLAKALKDAKEKGM